MYNYGQALTKLTIRRMNTKLSLVMILKLVYVNITI